MKTLKEFCGEHKDYSKLIKRVYKQLECETPEEFFETLTGVTLGGADAGFGGFIYYEEGRDFFKKNRKDIINLLYEDADELGESVGTMIKSFNSFRDNEFITEKEIMRALYGPIKEDDDDVYSVLSSYVLEKVAYWYEDDKEKES